MASNRADKNIFPFFNSVASPVSTTGVSDSFYNNGYPLMIIEVSKATSIKFKVEVCVNILDEFGAPMEDEDCSWTPVGGVDLSSFEVVEDGEKNGMFAFYIAGASRVRVNIESISGEATIVGFVQSGI